MNTVNIPINQKRSLSSRRIEQMMTRHLSRRQSAARRRLALFNARNGTRVKGGRV